MTRKEILDAAAQIVTQDREEQYGAPEDSLGLIASFWGLYLNDVAVSFGGRVDLLPEMVAHMMILLKIARGAIGKPKADNWIDIAGYAACGGELQGDK